MRDELAKLEELRQRGALTDDEFARAQAKVLAHPRALPARRPWTRSMR